jgi:hypothetical protein
MIISIDAYDINRTKITVIEVVFWFPPNHWYFKFQAAFLSICPLAQMLRTSFAYNIEEPMAYLDLQASHQNNLHMLFLQTQK